MANANIPRGLQPYAYMSGAPWGGALTTYWVSSNNGTDLFLGDPLTLVGTSSDANGIPEVEIATAGTGDQVLGPFMGISNNAGLSPITLLQSQTPWLAAGQEAYVYVADDPFLLYWIQEDSVGGAMANSAGGGNADLVAGSGSEITGFSGWQLDSSTLLHTQTTPFSQLRIIRALQSIDNIVGATGSPEIGINAKWLVKINQGISAFTNPAPT